MTVAERIKRETKPLSIERYFQAHKNCIKGDETIWVSNMSNIKFVVDVIYLNTVFIDGSTLECRVYL